MLWIEYKQFFLLEALVLITAFTCIVAEESYCSRLHEKHKTGKQERSVWIHGKPYWVSVYSDGSPPSMAAAGLLLAALRHGLRYRRLRMRIAPMDLCQPPDEDELVLAPAIVWNESTKPSCASVPHCTENDAGRNRSRLQVVGAGASPAGLQIFVHLTKHALSLPICKNATSWMFYSDKNLLETCGFIKEKEQPVLFVPTEWISLAVKLKEKAKNVGAQIRIENLSGSKPLENGSHRYLIQLLNNTESSFLLLTHEVWTNFQELLSMEPFSESDSECLPAFDISRTVRAADSSLRQSALSILEVFGRCSPTNNDLQNVLELETNLKNVEESACAWALDHHEKFQDWFQLKWSESYEVVIFVCFDDPDNAKYIKALEEIRKMYSKDYNFRLYLRFLKVICDDEFSTMRKFIERAQSVYWSRLIGVLAVGAGSKTISDLVVASEIALILYDVPTSDVSFNKGTRTATGQLSDLVLGFQYFLKECGTSRLGIISEDTKFSTEFSLRLRSIQDITVRDISIKYGPESALQHLMDANGRYIFINAKPEIALNILCVAYDKKMTPDHGYVWILREWRDGNINCENLTLPIEQFLVHTISFWWTGGDNAPLNIIGSERLVLEKLESLWKNQTWPPRAAPLVDAFTLLLHGFKHLTTDYPERQNDVHTPNISRSMWSSIKTKPVQGVAQKLVLEEKSIVNPLIFIKKWHGKKQQLKSILKIDNGCALVIYQPFPIFIDPPSDGAPLCRTTWTGDKFWPRCQDAAWFSAAVVLVLAIPALWVARRTRLERLARRQCRLTARLLARGERARAALAAHLIDRDALQLSRELGSGRFGRVRLGLLRPQASPSVVVAAKALREEASPAEEREFLSEAVILASLRHVNIIKLIGVCATGGSPLVVMEYACFGDLLKYLRERRYLAESIEEAYHVSPRALTRLGSQAAAALDYLRVEKLVHRDVRAANCLIDERRTLKLGDFGLARSLKGNEGDETDNYCNKRRGLLPVLWTAPESMQKGVFSAATDAWSLGVLLFELVTLGSRPFAEWPLAHVISYVCEGGHPPLPIDISPETRNLLLGCWKPSSERTTAADVYRELINNPDMLTPTLSLTESPNHEHITWQEF